MLKIIFSLQKKNMDGFSPEMFVTPTRAHPQQYADPSPPFIDDHRYYNVEGKVKLFRRSGARKNLLNMYYQTPVFGQQPPGHGQASSSSFREPKVNFRRSGARKIYLICIIRPLCLVNSHLCKLHQHLEFGKMLKNLKSHHT